MSAVRSWQCFVLGVLMLTSTPAHAASGRGGGPALRLSRRVGPPTTVTLVGGRGFGQSETVDLTFDQEPLGIATTDPSGAFETRIRVPATSPPGRHQVQATGGSSGLRARTGFVVNAEWAMFHDGPARTGSNPYENVLDPVTVRDLHVVWKFHPAFFFNASPALLDGVVYVQGYDFYALDARTGAREWTVDLGTNHTASSAAAARGLVYVGLVGELLAVDAATGTQAWTFPTGNSVDSSPAVAHGVVYVPSLDGNLYALDARTGSEVWRLHTGFFERSVPAVAGGVVYFGSADGHLYALDAATGAKLWAAPVPIAGLVGPAVADGVLYVGAADGTVHALNAASGQELWSVPTGADDIEGSPAVANGVVYVSSGYGDTRLHALDAATGNDLWTFRFNNGAPSSPVVANGVVYVDSPHGTIAALDAATGQKLWHYHAPGSVYSSPAVSNGLVYVASSQGSVIAFGL